MASEDKNEEDENQVEEDQTEEGTQQEVEEGQEEGAEEKTQQETEGEEEDETEMDTEGSEVTPDEPSPQEKKKETETGLDQNVAGALAYLAGLVTGIIFYAIEEENDFVRFHAAQSIILSVGFVILWVALSIISFVINIIPIIGTIISLLMFLILYPVIALLAFVLWIFLMYKAYQGERYHLPMIGDMAEDYV